MFEIAMSLTEMEHVLEKELLKEEGNIRILGDLNITQEDYRCLHLKVKGMKTQEQTIGLYEAYRLSMLTTWVFGMRYEKIEQVSYESIYSEIAGKPQHMIRMLLTIMEDTFREYKLTSFDIRLDSIEDVCQLLALHSGFMQDPDSGCFAFLEETMSYSDMNHLDYLYQKVLSQKTLEVCHLLDRKHLITLFQMSREVYMDCRVKGMTKEELLEKHPFVSRRFIENCVEFCQSRELEQDEAVHGK